MRVREPGAAASLARHPPVASEPDKQPPADLQRSQPGHWRPLFLLALVAAAPALAGTWYIRPDGGTPEQCDGRHDRPLADDHACAWRHPFHALPPGGAPRIAGGDTLRIAAGDYRIGIGAPGSERCDAAWPWDCHPPPLPSGTAKQPTVLSGADADGVCRRPPQWWGAERAAPVLNLDGSAHIVVDCLEITDHAGCIEQHCNGGHCREPLACPRDRPPFGDWSGVGIHAEDARDVTLRDVDVHGLALHGIQAGRIADWTLERVRIVGNGWSGWNGDVGDDSSNAGQLRFDDVEIAWNGCAEAWPSGRPRGCWAQSTGGYGDGLGTGTTGGDWQFRDVRVHDNTSDGLDLLYLDHRATLTIERLQAAGNAGNQLKLSGAATVRDSRIDGDCDRWRGVGNMQPDDLCRARGNAVSVRLQPGRALVLDGNAISGHGDCSVLIEGGDRTSRVQMRGNRLHPGPRWDQPDRTGCDLLLQDSAARVERQQSR